MSLSSVELHNEIKELSLEERALLLNEMEVEFIGALPVLRKAWGLELQRRIQEFRAMKVDLQEGEEVMREARTLLDAEL